MTTWRHLFALAAATTLLASGCSLLADDSSPGPSQTETAADSAKLPGNVTSTLRIRPSETPTGLIGNQIVLVEDSDPDTKAQVIQVVDRDTGATSWSSRNRFDGKTLRVRGTGDDAIVVSLAESGEQSLLAGLSPESGDVLWAKEYGGGQVQVVRGTGTALIATQSVPVIVSTDTGEELWRGEPGDQMQAQLSTAVVINSRGRKQVLWLKDGSRVQGGLKSKGLPIDAAIPADDVAWLLGRGGLSPDGATVWGNPGGKSLSQAGDQESSVIAIKTGKGEVRLDVYETLSGELTGTYPSELCKTGSAVGVSDGVLTWACPTQTTQTLINVAVR